MSQLSLFALPFVFTRVYLYSNRLHSQRLLVLVTLVKPTKQNMKYGRVAGQYSIFVLSGPDNSSTRRNRSRCVPYEYFQKWIGFILSGLVVSRAVTGRIV